LLHLDRLATGREISKEMTPSSRSATNSLLIEIPPHMAVPVAVTACFGYDRIIYGSLDETERR
jgi:hypothetical protein